jgi:hypothetical protein
MEKTGKSNAKKSRQKSVAEPTLPGSLRLMIPKNDQTCWQSIPTVSQESKNPRITQIQQISTPRNHWDPSRTATLSAPCFALGVLQESCQDET